MHFFIFLSFIVSCISQEKLLFVHIPKSGGITFRSILMDHYRGDEYINLTRPDLEPDKLNRLKNYPLLSGHMYYFDIAPLSHDFKKITVLRNPIKRVLSEHHYLYDRNHPDPKKMLKGHLLPEDGDPIYTAKNIACLCLSKLNVHNPNITIEQHLESAKDALLNDFNFIGITEKMDETISLLCDFLGWDQVARAPMHNTTRFNYDHYSKDIINGIAERNWADIELYEFACTLFEKQKQSIQPPTHKKNIIWQKTINYDINDVLDGFGWCPREKSLKQPFRWVCSPENAYINFPLISNSNYSLIFDLFIQPKHYSMFAIYINGKKIKTKVSKFSSNSDLQWIKCYAQIPKELLKENQITKIDFTLLDPDRTPSRDWYKGRFGVKNFFISQSD